MIVTFKYRNGIIIINLPPTFILHSITLMGVNIAYKYTNWCIGYCYTIVQKWCELEFFIKHMYLICFLFFFVASRIHRPSISSSVLFVLT